MDHNKQNNPEAADNQWLKELLASASDTPPSGEDVLDPADDQWLQELFASTELAAEQEFTQEAEEEEEPPILLDLEDPQWPEDATPVLTGEEIGADENLVAAAGLIRPEDAPLEQILQEFSTEEESDPQAAEESAPEEAEAAETEDSTPEISMADEETDMEDDEFDPDAALRDSQAPLRKRRPNNHRSYGLLGIPHVLVTAVWLVIILTFGVFLGQWLWKGASDVLAFGREDKVVTITITENDDLDSLIDKLQSAGLIHEPMWFRLYAQVTDVMEDIGTGTFELNTLFDYHALVSHMSAYSSARVTVSVTIPSGYTCAQAFALLEQKGVCSVADLEEAAMHGDLNEYWFTNDLDRSSKYCLEGYLFPDTYEFYVGDNATRVLNKFLSNFNTRFTDIMMGKLDLLNETLAEMMRKNGLSEEHIAEHAITIREVVIIASLIEKESANAKEGYTISSVIYNRLANPTVYPYLNIDAALVYATGNSVLTEEDKAFDSPYNTYLYPGLIPGAIANPSRASLDAALDPASTEYYFYVYDPATGAHHFSRTYAEHQDFLASLKKD